MLRAQGKNGGSAVDDRPERRGLLSPHVHTGPTQFCPGSTDKQARLETPVEAETPAAGAGAPRHPKVTGGPAGSGLTRRRRSRAASPRLGVGPHPGGSAQAQGGEGQGPGTAGPRPCPPHWRQGLALPHLLLRRVPASTSWRAAIGAATQGAGSAQRPPTS